MKAKFQLHSIPRALHPSSTLIPAIFMSLALLSSPAESAGELGANTLRGIKLPAELNGRWDFEGRASNTWTLRIDRIHDDGRIEGRITWWGVRCSVKDEALSEGSLREGRLRLRAPTDNRHACGDLLVDLRVGNKHLFEGEAVATLAQTTVKAWLERPR